MQEQTKQENTGATAITSSLKPTESPESILSADNESICIELYFQRDHVDLQTTHFLSLISNSQLTSV